MYTAWARAALAIGIITLTGTAAAPGTGGAGGAPGALVAAAAPVPPVSRMEGGGGAAGALVATSAAGALVVAGAPVPPVSRMEGGGGAAQVLTQVVRGGTPEAPCAVPPAVRGASGAARASATWLAPTDVRSCHDAPRGTSAMSTVQPTSPGSASDPRWVWPTGTRTILRPFVAPADDYAPGHRGIDVDAVIGAPAIAPAAGVVAFAGTVAGRGVVTIDHGDGLVSTLDSLEPLVRTGDSVEQSEQVGSVSVGHCPASSPCLHLGARIDGRYVDPTRFLSVPAWPVLLPMD